ncbi:unnamed protein product [Protopolystoma xenopodis]|uniref:Uncharacterized protein n=1 Tax=Protopolystoma xenopodis TaxID=117903 RepID=A0A448XQ61_9PLAT|nr:unnamed protein product [Protopolystoma xenopodis]
MQTTPLWLCISEVSVTLSARHVGLFHRFSTLRPAATCESVGSASRGRCFEARQPLLRVTSAVETGCFSQTSSRPAESTSQRLDEHAIASAAKSARLLVWSGRWCVRDERDGFHNCVEMGLSVYFCPAPPTRLCTPRMVRLRQVPFPNATLHVCQCTWIGTDCSAT